MTKTLSDLEDHDIHVHATYQSNLARGSEAIIRKPPKYRQTSDFLSKNSTQITKITGA